MCRSYSISLVCSLTMILGFSLALSMVVIKGYSYVLKHKGFLERKLYNK